MQNFVEALISDNKNPALPAAFHYFGKLIGSWAIDYIESNPSFRVNGIFMGS
ncbi:hypothetical protein [[Eubacterium] hominis]|uniref:hypothetical protein n=1 Tax=[Eubacterium] hominis TaxID=2764325 RepID=UPI003A4D1E33